MISRINKSMFLLGVFCLIILSGCTAISVPIYSPAEHDIGRDSRVTIETPYQPFSDLIRRDLMPKIIDAGYYTYADASSKSKGKYDALIVLDFSDCYISSDTDSYTHTTKDSDGHKVTHTHYKTTYSARGEVSFKIQDNRPNKSTIYKHFTTRTSDYNDPMLATNIAAGELSQKISDFITPKVISRRAYIWSRRANPYLEKAAMACKQDDWPLAKVYAKDALELTPDEPEANYLMGLIERTFQNYDSAAGYFQKAASLGDNSKYNDALEENEDQRNKLKIYKKQMTPKR